MTQSHETFGDKHNDLSPASEMPEATSAERESIERQSRPSAALLHETIRAEGLSELRRSSTALLLSGLAAGLSMGFSLMGEAVLRARLPEEPWAELITPLGYSLGFLIVILGRQQLFTENTLTPVLPLLRHRSAHMLGGVARLWSLVLVANIAGAWCVSWVLASAGVLEPAAMEAAGQIARKAVSQTPSELLLRGVFAGWLIALMVWLLPAAEGSRLAIIVVLTYAVALGGFAHVIAGSVDALYLHHRGELGLADYLLRFFLPTLAGNSLGGVTLVAALNYGQVAAEIEERD